MKITQVSAVNCRWWSVMVVRRCHLKTSQYDVTLTSHDVGGCASHWVRFAFRAVSASKEGLSSRLMPFVYTMSNAAGWVVSTVTPSDTMTCEL